MANEQTFLKTVQEMVEYFPKNAMCRRVDEKALTMEHYHALLSMIFHQTFQGPSTFALAGAHCDPRYHEVRDYLIHHADEEKTHWQWVIGDLQNTGYQGPDPKSTFPQPACQAYIAFNVYTAIRFPIARLAIATVLESIGASYGKKYSTKVIELLKLKPNQIVFFMGHGDTDVGHTEDLIKIIHACKLDAHGWDWMVHAAKTGGYLYRAMYDEAFKGNL